VYQTLVGAWPIERDRLDAYLEKALREGKVNSNWLEPNLEHERAVQEFAARAADAMHGDPFLARVAELGRRLSLAQLLLKLTAPGIPDLYQGDELENLSLVDPDNRRPVDWDGRRRALADLRAGTAPTAATAKLHVTATALELRARRAPAFAGAYEPIDLGRGVCAYTRGGEVLAAVGVAPNVDPVAPDGWRDVLRVRGLLLAERTG
jgi:(1->4)-alpha-D-glucan 1-alpha-D-glucosylmutase